MVQCSERLGVRQPGRRWTRCLRTPERHQDVRFPKSGRRGAGRVRVQGLRQGPGGDCGHRPPGSGLQGLASEAHEQEALQKDKVLQLWRIRQPHRRQVHDGSAAQEVSLLQERRPPHCRLSTAPGEE